MVSHDARAPTDLRQVPQPVLGHAAEDTEANMTTGPDRLTGADLIEDNCRVSMTRLGVPAYLRPGLAAYIAYHTPTGDFLRACLENNLARAVGHATTFADLRAVVLWLWNEADSDSWGSADKVAAWLAGKPDAEKDGSP